MTDLHMVSYSSEFRSPFFPLAGKLVLTVPIFADIQIGELSRAHRINCQWHAMEQMSQLRWKLKLM